MKKILGLILILSVLPAAAYQTGSVSRPQFKTAPAATEGQAEEKEKPSVPGQQGVQTRSFTSYSSRNGAWRQGVQTKTVQTQTAGRAVTPKDEETQVVMGGTKLTQQGKITKTAKAAGAEKQQPSAPAATPKAGDKAAQKPAADVPQGAQDPAAMMQQLQAMQSMMGALGGGSTPGGAQGSKGGTPAAGGAMPAGMPDLSSLMNMAGQGNTKK